MSLELKIAERTPSNSIAQHCTALDVFASESISTYIFKRYLSRHNLRGTLLKRMTSGSEGSTGSEGSILSKEEHDKIIKAKVGSFMLSSPIDTWRQNALLSKALTPRKIAQGMVSSAVASTVISIPCHYSMLQLDNLKMNGLFSFAVGIFVANIFKVPAVFYHKRCQVGAPLCARMPAEVWKKVLKFSCSWHSHAPNKSYLFLYLAPCLVLCFLHSIRQSPTFQSLDYQKIV